MHGIESREASPVQQVPTPPGMGYGGHEAGSHGVGTGAGAGAGAGGHGQFEMMQSQ